MTLPHPDATSWVDFVQCCQDLSFDWACVFPPEEAPSAAGHMAAPAATLPDDCLVGEHVLLLRGAPPPSMAARGGGSAPEEVPDGGQGFGLG